MTAPWQPSEGDVERATKGLIERALAPDLAYHFIIHHARAFAKAALIAGAGPTIDQLTRDLAAAVAERDRLRGQMARLDQVGAEIRSIMNTYREQMASARGLGTPGGLEHMGDVWRLMSHWEDLISG